MTREEIIAISVRKSKQRLPHISMNIALTKKAMSNGIISNYKTTTYDRHKREYVTQSLIDAWKNCHEFEQVSAGVNHDRRDVIILDCDRTDHKHLDEYLLSSNIPTFSYKIVSKESNHAQYGWLLDKYVSPKDAKTLVEELANRVNIDMLEYTISHIEEHPFADTCFTGWWCKNPFYANFETTFNGTVYNYDELRKSVLEGARHIERIDTSKEEKFIEKAKNTIFTHAVKYGEQQLNDKLSRNEYLMNNLRTEIFRYMNRNNGSIDKEYFKIRALQIADDAAIATGKNEREDENNINRTLESVIKFCEREWNEEFKDMWSDNARFIAALEKKTVRLRNLIKIKKIEEEYGKLNNTELSRLSGISRTSIVKYRKLDLNMFFEKLDLYKGYLEKNILKIKNYKKLDELNRLINEYHYSSLESLFKQAI